MKKIFYLVVICITLSGCQAKYVLKINKNLTVEESIVGLEDESFYNMFQASKKDVINSVLAPYNDYLKQSYYLISEIEDNNLYGAKIEKKYKNLTDFANYFSFYKPYFETFNIDLNDSGIISISLSNKKIDDLFSNRYIIDRGEISIIVPFKVLKHNADKYNSLENKYTWNFDLTNNTKSNIYIEFDTNEISQNYYIYLVVSFLCIIILLFILIFLKKHKGRNKV